MIFLPMLPLLLFLRQPSITFVDKQQKGALHVRGEEKQRGAFPHNFGCVRLSRATGNLGRTHHASGKKETAGSGLETDLVCREIRSE